jgi:NADP-dependent 3-hydroxy acid dehydrogenase YdfG
MMINGKLVLVSGASSGIGAATAKAMAKAGGRVVLLARRKEALDQVAAEITSAGGQAWTYRVVN